MFLKGELYTKSHQFFIDNGYTVKVFNLVDMLRSDRWNPLSVVKTDIDAQLFSEVVIANTGVPGRRGGDPFWDRAEMNLLKALTLYVTMNQSLPEEDRNMGTLYSSLSTGDSDYLNILFKTLPRDHPARIPFNIYTETDPKVRSGVIIGLGTRLQVYQNELVRKLTAASDIDLELPGKEKCAYFCIISDMDATFSFLSSLFFSFLFIKLTRLADQQKGALPVPVNFLLDEFPNIGRIPDFPRKLSTMRSRAIACSVVFQSLGQMKTLYPDSEWETILGNCASWLVMGAQDVLTAKYVSEHLGKGTVEAISTRRRAGFDGMFDMGSRTQSLQERYLRNPDEIIRMDRQEAMLSSFGLPPMKLRKLDYTRHPLSKKLVIAGDYSPEWSKSLIVPMADVQEPEQLEEPIQSAQQPTQEPEQEPKQQFENQSITKIRPKKRKIPGQEAQDGFWSSTTPPYRGWSL